MEILMYFIIKKLKSILFINICLFLPMHTYGMLKKIFGTQAVNNSEKELLFAQIKKEQKAVLHKQRIEAIEKILDGKQWIDENITSFATPQ